MSNLLKSLAISYDENERRVIDSNEAVSIKLSQIRERLRQEEKDEIEGFTLGLNPEHIEELLEDGEYENDEGIEYVDSTDNAAIDNEALLKQQEDFMHDMKEQAGLIIERAEKDAEKIIEKAKHEAQQIMIAAREEGYSSGVARVEEQIQKEVATAKEKLEQARNELETEYRDKLADMEPQLVETILKVFDEVIHAISEDKKEMILSLVNSVLSGGEVSKNYLIRVCKEDAIFLRENKEKIIGSVGRDISIEIIEDPLMKRNDCIIDTDLGIYDCGLDIQLENLMQDIKILACSTKKY